MKKITISLALLVLSISTMAMSRSKVREYARFLSDRMAYELGLTSMQYDDCYEINYDFVYAVGDMLDDVVYGYSTAVDNYYTYLDYRNEDLSYVLTSSQYARFLTTECFYRPFCIYDGSWAFRPYMIYSNRTYFYMSLPFGYHAYRGAHCRRYYNHGFYVGRYNHGPRHDFAPIRHREHFGDWHRHDFGPVRSGHVGAPSHGGSNHRPGPAPQTRPGYDHRSSGGRVEHHSQSRPDQGNHRQNNGGYRSEGNRGRYEGNVGNRPERSETRPQRSETRPERTETRPQRSETRPERTETRPQRRETRPERTETRPQRSETRPERSESRPQRSETRPERTETRPQRSETRPERTESRPQRTETRPQGQQGRPSQGGGGVMRRGRG